MQKKLEEFLNQAAETLILADPDDTSSLEELIPIFGNLNEFLQKSGVASCSEVLEHLLDAISIFKDVSSDVRTSILDVINEVIETLLPVAHDRIAAEDVTFSEKVTSTLAAIQKPESGIGAEPEPQPEPESQPEPEPEQQPEPEPEPQPKPEPEPELKPKPESSKKMDMVPAVNDMVQSEDEEALTGRYLSFFLDKEEFCFEILKVQEIIRMTEITRIPRTPHYIRGLINLRGQVVAVFDLRAKFEMSFTEETEHTCIVVVKVQNATGKATMGVIVDAVSEVLQIHKEEVKSVDKLTSQLDSSYLLGMAIINDQVKILLDIDQILFVSKEGAPQDTAE